MFTDVIDWVESAYMRNIHHVPIFLFDASGQPHHVGAGRQAHDAVHCYLWIYVWRTI